MTRRSENLRSSEPARRDERRERCWLEAAELRAERSNVAAHANRRLAAGERAYGNRWTELGVVRLLTELAEEAADLGAWGVLALQALEHDTGIRTTQRDAIANALHDAILYGAHAHAALTRARAATPERLTP
jgi:hypothetical protein